MISSDDLMLVSLLAKEKSLAAVARVSNISPSAISQRLTALEAKLGIRIADRIGRSGVVLTSEGELLAERGALVLSELRQLDDQLAEKRGLLSGHLRVIAPLGFGRIHIAPLVGKFQQCHPDISVALTLSDAMGRLPQSGWDIIIRVGPLRESSLQMIELASNKRLLCASPEYVAKHGFPVHPDELREHHCIVIYEDNEDVTLWSLLAKNGTRRDIRITPQLSSNDGQAALSWALSGRGIIMRSEWSAYPHIASGELVPLLSGWDPPEAPILALTSGPRGRPSRVQIMLNYLQSHIKGSLGFAATILG